MNFIIERQKYQLVKGLYAEAGQGNTVIVPSTLRSEAALSTSNSFSFNVQKDQGSSFNTEIRLRLNDGFTITDIGLFVAKPGSATDTTFKLYTYPSESEFSTANCGEALRGLYNNGTLQITKNQVNYIENWDLYKHFCVNAIQQSVSYAGYTTASSTAANPADQQNGSTDGFFPLATPFTFTGQDNIQISVNTPVALAAVESNSRLVLMFRGYIAYNAAR